MVKRFSWYKADDEKVKFKRKTPKPTKLKHNLVPGSVIILLAGRFRGKRVIFLKQLESGLLLVTGPYKVNGVPLKRVNQKYTIATSKIIPVDDVNVENINDDFFKKDKVPKKKGSEAEFFAEKKDAKKEIKQERKDVQVEVDGAILKNIKGTMEAKYLNARFTLTKNMKPHNLVF